MAFENTESTCKLLEVATSSNQQQGVFWPEAINDRIDDPNVGDIQSRQSKAVDQEKLLQRVSSVKDLLYFSSNCAICKEQVGRLYHGIYCCDGCKDYFRWSIAESWSYKCNIMENCVTNKYRQRVCRFCRLLKRFAADLDEESALINSWCEQQLLSDKEIVTSSDSKSNIQPGISKAIDCDEKFQRIHERGLLSKGNASFCAVCNQSGAELCYGVYCCFECINFFQRTILNVLIYQCDLVGDCQVNGNSHDQCKYCRLQKCYAVGLQKESVLLYYFPKPKLDGTQLMDDEIPMRH